MSTYNDPFISLKNLALTQFESNRDIPASIELISRDPNKLDIQSRTLLQKIHAALTNFDVPEIVVAIGPRELSVFNLILSFLHGNKKEKVSYYGPNPEEFTIENRVTREILKNFTEKNFIATETELSKILLENNNSFVIGLFSSGAVNEVRNIIDAFSVNQSGILFIQNYSRLNSPSHHLYAAERNLRLLELPDGSGECYSIKSNK